jgi:hypothetical protein
MHSELTGRKPSRINGRANSRRNRARASQRRAQLRNIRGKRKEVGHRHELRGIRGKPCIGRLHSELINGSSPAYLPSFVKPTTTTILLGEIIEEKSVLPLSFSFSEYDTTDEEVAAAVAFCADAEREGIEVLNEVEVLAQLRERPYLLDISDMEIAESETETDIPVSLLEAAEEVDYLLDHLN